MLDSIDLYLKGDVSKLFVDVYHPEWSSKEAIVSSVELFRNHYMLSPGLIGDGMCPAHTSSCTRHAGSRKGILQRATI